MTHVEHSKLDRRLFLQISAACAATTAVGAFAQGSYPSRPVRIVVPYAPGGSADVVARLVALKLGEHLGKPFIVDNKPGAAGNIGFEQVIRSAADGYTLALVADSNVTVNPHLYKRMSFDPLKDARAVALLATIGIGLVVHPSVPANTVQEFVSLSRSTQGGLSYATPGTGTPMFLAGELLKQMAGAQLVHVGYKGGAPALQDVVSNQVPAGIVALAIAAPHIKAGKLKLLAVTQEKRSSLFPATPTIGEAIKGFDATAWLAVYAPPATPPEVVKLINTEINKVLTDPGTKGVLEGQALDVVPGTPEQLTQRASAESARWGNLIQVNNIKVD